MLVSDQAKNVNGKMIRLNTPFSELYTFVGTYGGLLNPPRMGRLREQLIIS